MCRANSIGIICIDVKNRLGHMWDSTFNFMGGAGGPSKSCEDTTLRSACRAKWAATSQRPTFSGRRCKSSFSLLVLLSALHIVSVRFLVAATMSVTPTTSTYPAVGGSLYVFPSFSVALQYYGYSHVALLGSIGNVRPLALQHGMSQRPPLTPLCRWACLRWDTLVASASTFSGRSSWRPPVSSCCSAATCC